MQEAKFIHSLVIVFKQLKHQKQIKGEQTQVQVIRERKLKTEAGVKHENQLNAQFYGTLSTP